ncbi:MAG: hypothetical protein B6244_08395 [Candidatus Cloacimonetes bacterium 4572_55]|nr:MAG: hypothetical protein B6244_08395 [Candidatus Cloacimonetes bacterium 4572_55]
MRQMLIVLPFLFFLSPQSTLAQPLERVIQSLPIFVACAGIQTDTGALIVGVFSESQDQVNPEILAQFRELKAWYRETVISITLHDSVLVIPVNKKTLSKFNGHILWVIDADKSSKTLRKLSRKGVFTIAMQNEKMENALFAVVHYNNISEDKNIEKWRLVKFVANCTISPLRFNRTIRKKDSYVEKGCD